MKSPFQTTLPPGFIESLVADAEAEEDAIERLIAAHASGDCTTTLAVLDELLRLRGLPITTDRKPPNPSPNAVANNSKRGRRPQRY